MMSWGWVPGPMRGEQGFWGLGEAWKEVKGCSAKAFFLFLEPPSWFHLWASVLAVPSTWTTHPEPCLASFFSRLRPQLRCRLPRAAFSLPRPCILAPPCLSLSAAMPPPLSRLFKGCVDCPPPRLGGLWGRDPVSSFVVYPQPLGSTWHTRGALLRTGGVK